MSTELRPNTITPIWGFAMLPSEVLKDLHKDYSYTQIEGETCSQNTPMECIS